MSAQSQLEEQVFARFEMHGRLPSGSGPHRRFSGRMKNRNELLLVSCASYGPLPDDCLELQRQVGEKMKHPGSPALIGLLDAVYEAEFHWQCAVIQGEGLRECLRTRQSLTPAQAGWIMSCLAEAATAAVRDGWPRLLINAAQVCVDLNAGRAWLLPPDMPLFGVATLQMAMPQQTMAFNPASFAAADEPVIPTSSRDYVSPLAALCCEMLGSAASSIPSQNERFRSIPALNSHQNTLLRSALAGTQRHHFESVEEFVSQFTALADETTGSYRVTTSVHAPTSAATATLHGTSRETAARPTGVQLTRSQAVTTPVVPLKDRDLLADLPPGYTLTRELRHGPCWRLVSAVHPSLGPVLLTSVDVSGETAESVRVLNGMLQALQKSSPAAPSSNDLSNSPELIVRPAAIVTAPHTLHVARPLPAGASLLDELRERRAFTPVEAAGLLRCIFDAYENLWSCVQRRLLASTLDRFWLAPVAAGQTDARALVMLDASQMIVEAVMAPAALPPNPVVHFARLTLLLLGQDGGSLGGEGVVRFTAVPEISAEVNGVLRRALNADQNTGEMTLVQLLDQILTELTGREVSLGRGDELEEPPSLSVPPPWRAVPLAPAVRLRLMPQNAAADVLALSAADELRLGRGMGHSDFVAQFRPRSNVNDARTMSISRHQATLKWQEGNLVFEEQDVTNPSQVGDHAASSGEPLPLPSSLLLAGEYPLLVRQVKSSGQSPEVEGWPAADPQRSKRRGAFLIRAMDRGVLPFQAAWVFSEVGLALNENGDLLFDDPSAPRVFARFHRHAGTFWIEAAPKGTLECNGTVLEAGDVVPLKVGDKLHLQGILFEVTACELT
ncbi:hypothetical protein [Prosthecobacter sp.]|uniref:hypothetical protein n=1 Tax=Prosthecobacter sp. TaxID=1965333 RepID=UPI001DEB20D0|nr:hypothetical protein [Prosthecobacter sp.]MCB1276891.1 hypothetical protein [Prosthecobacter sp.]